MAAIPLLPGQRSWDSAPTGISTNVPTREQHAEQVKTMLTTLKRLETGNEQAEIPAFSVREIDFLNMAHSVKQMLRVH